MNLELELNVDELTQPEFAKWAVLATKLAWYERVRQNRKWGDGHFEAKSNDRILTVLTEEVGEIARAILDGDKENLLEEVVQVAAVALAFVELLLKQQAQGDNSNDTHSGVARLNSYAKPG